MRTRLFLSAMLAASPLLLGACQTADAQEAIDGATPAPTSSFAQGVCGACHAVEAPWHSPNPQAPTFVDIANRPGISEESLADWLKDAHNYPDVMDVDLGETDAEELAAYMLTLRSPDYVRLPD